MMLIGNQPKHVLDHVFLSYVKAYGDQYENMIDYSRDNLIDFFGFKTLERAYLLRVNNKIVEPYNF